MKVLLAFIISFSTVTSISQISYENYLIKDVGHISIPKSLELQGGKFREFAKEAQKKANEKFKYEILDQRIVFQNIGVNNFDKESLNEYARVIIETKIKNYGDYEKLTTKIKASKSELAELNNQMKKSAEENLKRMGSKIVKWYNMQIVLVNGRTALKSSYIRQLNKDQPYVYVTMYQFHNNDRIHFLTLSCREKDGAKWKIPFQTVLNSFVITNVR